MIERIEKMIHLGIILIIMGLIIVIFSIIFFARPQLFLSEEVIRLDFGRYIFYGGANLVFGIILFLIGISLYATGMRDMYFRPLKQLLYPQSDQNSTIKNPIQSELRIIECEYCTKAILLDSIVCPYCGIKQLKDSKVIVKKIG